MYLGLYKERFQLNIFLCYFLASSLLTCSLGANESTQHMAGATTLLEGEGTQLC